MATHLVIPDTQVKPGNSVEFLTHIGKYIVEKKPDTIIHLGDHADMPSLSSYDRGKKSFEGRRYRHDIEAAKAGMDALLGPLKAYNAKQRKTKHQIYSPRLVFLLGNHEHRIDRAIEQEPILDGTISTEDLGYSGYGWEVYPFLQPVVIDGVCYAHYFVSGTLGRPCVSAQAQLTKKHMSCIAGHQQGLQIATSYRADGKRLTSVIAGSCYEHNEDYMGPQGNKHWRGILVLHEINDGEFDLMPVSLNFLTKKYA